MAIVAAAVCPAEKRASVRRDRLGGGSAVSCMDGSRMMIRLTAPTNSSALPAQTPSSTQGPDSDVSATRSSSFSAP